MALELPLLESVCRDWDTRRAADERMAFRLEGKSEFFE
jgi:hypothetical protein